MSELLIALVAVTIGMAAGVAAGPWLMHTSAFRRGEQYGYRRCVRDVEAAFSETLRRTLAEIRNGNGGA